MTHKKATAIHVLQILQKYSDDQHYLTQNDIICLLKQDYDIDAERKAIGRMIDLLCEADYDIARKTSGGYALIARTFDEGEIAYLLDSVYSSGSISPEETSKLQADITSTLSIYERKKRLHVYKRLGALKKDKRFFRKVALIEEAIRNGHKLRFSYCTYQIDGSLAPKREKPYYCNPYYMVNDTGRYYLLCTVGRNDNLVVFRVDMMSQVEELQEEAPSKRSLETFRDFDPSVWVKTHTLGMNGNPIRAHVEIKSPLGLSVMYDAFGSQARAYQEGDKTLATIDTDDMSFYYWAMQFVDCVKVLAPEAIVKKMKESARSLLDEEK